MFYPKGEILRFIGRNAAQRMAHVEMELQGSVTRVSPNELRVIKDTVYEPTPRPLGSGFQGSAPSALSVVK